MEDTEISKPAPRRPVSEACKIAAANFFFHTVGQSAAALAYFLLFSIFPLLIFVSNLLGILELDVNAITQYLGELLPADAVSVVEGYLAHVSDTSSSALMLFALVFSVWFPFRAVRGLMLDVRRAYREPKPNGQIKDVLKQLIITVVFVCVIMLTLLLTVMGERLITFFIGLLPANTLNISGYILTLWQYLRFLPIAALMIFGIATLYALSLDRMLKIRSILPGTAFALFGWLLVSIGFSFYVEHFSHYATIYGTLGTVVVLLIWLYLTAIMLIMGAELNAAISSVRQKYTPK